MKRVDGFHQPDGRPREKSVCKDKIYPTRNYLNIHLWNHKKKQQKRR